MDDVDAMAAVDNEDEDGCEEDDNEDVEGEEDFSAVKMIGAGDLGSSGEPTFRSIKSSALFRFTEDIVD